MLYSLPIRADLKGLPGMNPLAYFSRTPVTKKKRLMRLTPGANVINHFCPKVTTFHFKLALVPAELFQPSLMSVAKARSLPFSGALEGASLV